jgi:hypothetical protein
MGIVYAAILNGISHDSLTSNDHRDERRRRCCDVDKQQLIEEAFQTHVKRRTKLAVRE